jgi:DHA1 family bicyclomycin/chloramphenicol resistance-like MFS transporter
MHPQAATLWRGPPWALSLLLATLSMLAPFAIDAYLPAFDGMARELPATPVQMQQTLSVFLLAFAAMNLFHGALSDSLGRRPVVLTSLAVFSVSSVGCALSPTLGWLLVFRALQGLSAGGGMVVARAIIRDLYPPAQAQRVMSQVTIFFGAAPALAPMIGGVLYVGLGWPAVFWLLALIGLAQCVVMWRRLPESLHVSQRQPLNVAHLLRGYWQVGASARFLALALASALPFNGMFIYVLSAPAWLGGHLQLAPTQFFWFFALSVSGVMGGAWVSGRLAGRIPLQRQVALGLAVCAGATAVNLLAHAVLELHVAWALIPVSVYSFGWSLMVPAVTLMLLDMVPERRGMASSVQAFIGALTNAAVAGVLAPLVMHSAMALALASAGLLLVGAAGWWWVRGRWPQARQD